MNIEQKRKEMLNNEAKIMNQKENQNCKPKNYKEKDNSINNNEESIYDSLYHNYKKKQPNIKSSFERQHLEDSKIIADLNQKYKTTKHISPTK